MADDCKQVDKIHTMQRDIAEIMARTETVAAMTQQVNINTKKLDSLAEHDDYMRKVIFGNGRPGLIGDIKEDQHKQAVALAEIRAQFASMQAWLRIGVITVITSALGFLGLQIARFIGGLL